MTKKDSSLKSFPFRIILFMEQTVKRIAAKWKENSEIER